MSSKVRSLVDIIFTSEGVVSNLDYCSPVEGSHNYPAFFIKWHVGVSLENVAYQGLCDSAHIILDKLECIVRTEHTKFYA